MKKLEKLDHFKSSALNSKEKNLITGGANSDKTTSTATNENKCTDTRWVKSADDGTVINDCTDYVCP